MARTRPLLAQCLVGAVLTVSMVAPPTTAQPPPEEEPPSEEPRELSEEKLECVRAYEQSQRDRRDGRLLETRRQLLECTQPVCPPVIRRDCTEWLGEVEKALPSLVVRVQNAEGQDLLDAHVHVDDASVELTGKAHAVDPGPHQIRVRASGYLPFDRTFVVVEGQKHRAIVVTLARPEPTEPEPPPLVLRRPLVPPLVLGGVSVVGFAGLTYFGLKARHDEHQLKNECQPACKPSDVDPVRTKYMLANVSLGIGIAGAVGTVSWVLFAKPRPVPRATSSRRVNLSITPTPTGGSATLLGRF